MKLINYSKPGACNYHIFQQVMSALDDITDGDLAVINWSHIDRHHLASGQGVLMPHAQAPNRHFVESYYRYKHDDLESLSQVMAYTHYVKSKLSCDLLYSLSDDILTLGSISESFANELGNDTLFVHDSGHTPVYLVKHHRTLRFECSHPNEHCSYPRSHVLRDLPCTI